MEHTPIKTHEGYRAALKEIESVMAAELDTPDGERLNLLVTLVAVYESTQWDK